MKRYVLGAGAVMTVLLVLTAGCKSREESPQALATQMDTISYCVGVVFGSNLQKDGFDTIDTKQLARGLSDYVDKKEPLIDKDRAKQILLEYHAQQFMAHQVEKFSDNKIAGEKFLRENSKREGVVTLPSGLQYRIIRQGHGPKPGPDDLVLVHYKGELIDGTVFEDHLTGKPIPFFVNRVIKGWKEALQLMPEGSRWKVYVPYQLGYGTVFNPNSAIQPFSTLIFDIELVKVEKRKN
jgi:FKBP-type peptidyl-prolyl cis-trans isomerase FklB